MQDTTTFIGQEAKAIMSIINDLDPYFPDEDLFEVLVGEVNTWGTIEAQLLFPALEAAFEGVEDTIVAARKRLNTLYALQGTIHEGEGAEGPFNELAKKYIDAVKYHLLVDIDDIAPLTAQLPEELSRDLAVTMRDMKDDLE